MVFETADDAARAITAVGRPVPAVPGVPAVPSVWLEAEQPLVKGKSDKWARKGATTRVWLRPATADDIEEKAVSTAGARTHGLLGENLRRKEAQAKRQARMLRAQQREQERMLLELDPRIRGHSVGGTDHGWKRQIVLHTVADGAAPIPDALTHFASPVEARRLPMGPLSFVQRKPAPPKALATSGALGESGGASETDLAATAEAAGRSRGGPRGAFGGAVRPAKRGRGAARAPSPSDMASTDVDGASMHSASKRPKAEGTTDAGAAATAAE